ncbi:MULTISPECIES: peptidylprolyl isomerase [Caballeronia]|jgi:peptidyl-prolyl cis-trans isomerase SurA|uniref:Chaperone SurA n=1 Tax=Caballeronia jiangsuensis TaxID=1458357 RepID=A0ABW9CEW4_9BURK|nr:MULTISPECIES: peptidylprolyl isomerase [Caballeronia]MBC8638678.1 peptidylprolyl isomerase [Caballeronia sp. EK]
MFRSTAIAAGVLAGALILSSPAGAQALSNRNAQVADSVVAVVNDGVITQRELQDRTTLIVKRLQQQNAPVPPADQMQRQVLDQMVLERIQLQKAKEDGIAIDDATVNRTLARLAQQNQMTLDVYRSRIEAQGVPWSTFTRDARTELTLSKLREKEVDSKITVSDGEVANYIASQRGPGARNTSDLRLQHIMFKLPSDAPQGEVAKVQAQADAVLKQAQGGEDFAKLAKQNSQDTDASKGGDLGFRTPGTLPAGIVNAVSTLRPGQVVPTLLRTDGGFEIIKLVDRRASQGTAADAPKLVQTHVRHILLRVSDGMSEQAARQKLLDIKQQVASGGDFANFARTYSQDGSASQGGDLGWISPGETVPEFERAMNNLQDGAVSDPVRSEYGYHLIQVLGRREAEGSASQQLDIARQAIGQRKAEQAYSDWLRELRDTAYVQYKGIAALPQ